MSFMNMQAQVTNIATNLQFPYDAALYGNDLYIAELGAGRLVKVDITAAIPAPIEAVLTGLANPAAMALDGDFLYYGESNLDRISRINLTDATPTPEVVVNTGLSTPNDLFVDGDILYITDEGNDRLMSVNLTETFPIAPVTIVSGLNNPLGITKFGDDLYLSIFGSASIAKVDITQTPAVVTTVLSGLTRPAGLTVNGGFLYIAEDNRISRMDLNAENPTAEVVVTEGILGSRNVAFDGIDLYLAQTGGTFGMTGVVSRLTINTPAFASLADVCANDMPNMLTGASPGSGTYSGPGVTDNGDGNTFSFDPTAAGGPGTYTINYTLGGAMASSTLTVVPAPTVTFSTGGLSVQVDAGVQTGLGGGMPAGGVYSGNGVTDDGNGMTYSFDPAAAGEGDNVITYTFTDANGCSGEQGAVITVTPATVPGDLCAESIDISSLFGGTFNEPQVSSLYDNTPFVNGSDNPAAGFECFYNGDGLQNTGWFSFTGDGNTYRMRNVQCTGPNDNLDLQVVIYSGGCGNLVAGACNEDEDGGNGVFNFSVEFETEVGVEYVALIDGFDGTTGEFCLEVTNLTEPTPGAALDFDGVDDRVVLPHENLLDNLTGDYTISAWVNIDDNTVNQPVFSASNASGVDLFLSANFTAFNGPWFLISGPQGSGSLNASEPLSTNEWHHLLVSYEAASSSLSLYVDGILVDNATTATTPSSLITTESYLGFLTSNSSATGYFSGQIDEFRITSSASNCYAVNQQATCQLADDAPNLEVYYRFNQGMAGEDNTDITELTATAGPNGTLQNFALTGNASNFVAEGAVESGTICGPVNEATLVSVNGNNMVIPNGDDSPSVDDGTDFGDVAIGETASREFHIIAEGALGFNGVTIDNPAFIIGAVNPQTGMFPISITPTAIGEQIGTVSVNVEDCTIDNVYTYTIRANGIEAALSGDECSDANDLSSLFGQAEMVPQLSDEYNHEGYTYNDNDPTTNSCGWAITDYPTIWYSFTGDGNRYSITSTGTDVAATIYSGDCENLTEVACNDDAVGTDFGFELQTEAGVTYLISVVHALQETGAFNIEVTNLGTVGVQDIQETAIQLFPNPTTGFFKLQGVDATRVLVFDQLGRQVAQFNQTNQEMDIQALPAGVYVLRIEDTDGQVYSARVVKE